MMELSEIKQKLFLMTNYPVLDHILVINDILRLIIYDASLSDSNVYTCRASNEAGAIEKSYNIVVKGDIIFTKFSYNILLVENYTYLLIFYVFEFNCS